VRRQATKGGLGPRVRVRPWAFDPGVVQVSLADQAIVPRPDELAGWIETLSSGDWAAAAAGVDLPTHTIRTGALFPEAAARFADAGFTVIDTLALLRIDIDDRRPDGSGGTSPLRPSRHREAALVDRAAFGDPWGNEARDLAEIRRATPAHRARARYERARELPAYHRRLVAFAITGAASGQGYLQRLAVDPAHQRRGHGRALVLDSLEWMRRRRLTQGLVNTAIGNAPALALYESLGFHRLPQQLLVMQLDLPADR
jgi:GNAT superfamily N-acetyltransferase